MSLCNILATDKIEIMFSRIRKKTDAAVFFFEGKLHAWKKISWLVKEISFAEAYFCIS